MMSRILSRLNSKKFKEEKNPYDNTFFNQERRHSDYQSIKHKGYSDIFSNVLNEFKYQRKEGNLFSKFNKIKNMMEENKKGKSIEVQEDPGLGENEPKENEQEGNPADHLEFL